MPSPTDSVRDTRPERDHALLLLSDRAAIEHINGLLLAGAQPLSVTIASSLQEAIVFGTPDALRLAVLDAALCDALEREFVEHLLATLSQLHVVLLDDGPPAGLMPRPSRLDCVPRHRLLSCVDGWLQSQARGAPS